MYSFSSFFVVVVVPFGDAPQAREVEVERRERAAAAAEEESGRREQEAARGLQEAEKEIEKAKAEAYALQVPGLITFLRMVSICPKMCKYMVYVCVCFT